jgi:hypothetical protein
MANWDFDTEEEALDAFRARTIERLQHAYDLREGALVDEPGHDPGAM